MRATAFSSGKLIISGEHSVVYGYPALAVPLSLGLTVTLNTEQPTGAEKSQPLSPFIQYIQNVCENFFQKKWINLEVEISSQLPQNAGLGSSAALAHAYVQAYRQLCQVTISQTELLKIIFDCEKFAHSNPSGIDAAVIVHQQPIVFIKKNPEFSVTYKPVGFFPLSECVLLHSGPATESTKDMVDQVARQPKKDLILKQIGQVTEKLLQALENHQSPWKLLTENQRLLGELQVVGEKAHQMIQTIEAAGGHAKICGAGGLKTGSGVMLAYHVDKQALFDLISQYSWQYNQSFDC